jgi:hypothetical protein
MKRCTPVAVLALLAVLACAPPSQGATITFQNGVLPDTSYAGCQDNWIYAYYPTTNYGTNTWGNGIGYYSTGIKRSLIRFDISSISSSATVSAAKLRLLMYTIGANRTLEAYQVLRPWTQTASTWNNYATSLAWTTAGCGGVGTDVAGSATGTVAVTTGQAGTWIEIPLSTSLVQGWVDGTASNNGVLLKDTTEAAYEMRYRAENYTTASERPQLVIEHTTGGGGGGDTTAPAAVSNLATANPTGTSIQLSWTAPGDDGATGTATSYDIRYSTISITDGNWAGATQVTGEPTPAAAGTAQNMTVSGLNSDTTYYFAMKTSDEVPNTSALSNVPSGTTLDVTSPAAVSNLAAGTPTTSSLTLAWTAPGDDGATGTATSYDIRYSTSSINDGNWASATQVTGEPTPAAAGSAQDMIVSGLSSGTTYYFAMKASDEVPNTSTLSNVASGQTSTGVGSGIAMIVEEHNAIARSGEVISGGVPFAVGDLTSTTGLRVEDSGGNPVPAQFAVLNRWWAPNYDDSIKWVQVVFPASVAASGSGTYYLTTGTNPSPADPVNVAINGSTYTVTTGPLKAVINGAAFKLFDEVYLDADDDGLYETGEKIVQAGATDGLVITSGDWSALGIAAGDEFRSSVGTATVTVEESGPVRAVLCVKGTMQRSGLPAVDPYYEYTIRLYFTAGSAKVRCHVTLKNNRIVNYTVYSWPIEDLSLRSTLALTGTKSYAMLGQAAPVRGTVGANVVKLYQDSNGTTEWQTTGGTAIQGVTFQGYRMFDGTNQLEQNNQARGWMDLSNGTLGVAAGGREFWQQYPKALRISGSQLQVALLPTEWSEPFSIYDGSRKRHEVVYNFHTGSLTDQQITDSYLLAERPLHMRCSPSTYVASKTWDLGLGEVANTSLSTYDKYATTGTGIGGKLGWDWYGKYYAWNAGGMHPNEGSMFMAYVLWGDWRKFENSETMMLWTDLAGVVAFDQYNFATDWHYLIAYPNDGSTGITKMRHPGWYNRCTQTRADSGHCGMLQNLEYYYLTGDRHALELVKYYGQLANYYLWPRFDKVPRFYSSYNGDVDDPNFKISDRYYGWPVFNLVQAYEATGDAAWLSDATIAIRGFRNTLRTSPLKFTSEILHPINDTTGIYASYWSTDAKDNGASQGYAIFQMAITAKSAGLYYLATGDMDAFDVMAAHGDFLSDTSSFRDGSQNLLGWPYCWGDYWGPSTTTASVHPDLANALGMSALLSRRTPLQSDAEDAWALSTNKDNWIYLGYLMQAASDPSADQTAPAAVSSLAAAPAGTGQITVSWTAPGDNGTTGTAWRYQLKYSTSPIVESVTNWPDLTPPVPQTVADWQSLSASFLGTQRPFVHGINVLGLPTPAAAGTQQSKTVTGLTTGTRYYFAIKTLDAAGNVSGISNVVNAVAP